MLLPPRYQYLREGRASRSQVRVEVTPVKDILKGEGESRKRVDSEDNLGIGCEIGIIGTGDVVDGVLVLILSVEFADIPPD